MEYLLIALLMAAVFGICWLVDKGFTKLFRSKAQHHSGLSVRLNKRYGSGGLVLLCLGLAGMLAGAGENWFLLAASAVVLLVGVGLIVYYMTFGVYYDNDTFLYSSFGRKDVVYRYRDIVHQQLYVITGGNMLVELHMADGSAVQIYSQMAGSKEFLSHAHTCWCRQKGLNSQEHYDPENYIYFPSQEER